MVWSNPPNEKITEILKQSKTIAVVGLSDNPERTSYQIAEAMQKSGYKIIPINPFIDYVLGERAYDSLLEVEDEIHIINVFRQSQYVPAIAKEAIQTNCQFFWTQQGVINEEAYDFLKKHNVTVIMDLCIKVAHAILT